MGRETATSRTRGGTLPNEPPSAVQAMREIPDDIDELLIQWGPHKYEHAVIKWQASYSMCMQLKAVVQYSQFWL